MMKLILMVCVALISLEGMAQKEKKAELKLKNALVIGQLNNPEERYTVEINVTELLSSNGIKTLPSLNILKLGGDSQVLATDSMVQLIKSKGIDTYLLVSVRGYDRKFKPSTIKDNFEKAVSVGSLFDLYRQDIVSVSFEFKFFRGGEYVFGDVIKCGNISDRSTVIKRLRKKLIKRIPKKWK